MKSNQSTNFNNYIEKFPADGRAIIQRMHAIIMKAAPKAIVLISYSMPAYQLNGEWLVYFALYKNHIGFYPRASGIAHFKKELASYKSSKGAVQFPIDKRLPIALISAIVQFREKEVFSKSKHLRICPRGHKYYKSSDCPVCPVCEKVNKPTEGFLSLLGAPARRALQNKGISTLKKLSRFSEKEILALHGMGKTSIPVLVAALKKEGLNFKKQ